MMKAEFLRIIDENLESMGFGDRAQFIRKAVREKLAHYNVQVPAEYATAPSRAGKGGRRKKLAPVDEGKTKRTPA